MLNGQEDLDNETNDQEVLDIETTDQALPSN